MVKGKVKFFNDAKGYGFIIPDNSSEEIYVHETGLKDFVHTDDRVVFELTEGRRGLNATNVRKISDAQLG